MTFVLPFTNLLSQELFSFITFSKVGTDSERNGENNLNTLHQIIQGDKNLKFPTQDSLQKQGKLFYINFFFIHERNYKNDLEYLISDYRGNYKLISGVNMFHNQWLKTARMINSEFQTREKVELIKNNSVDNNH